MTRFKTLAAGLTLAAAAALPPAAAMAQQAAPAPATEPATPPSAEQAAGDTGADIYTREVQAEFADATFAVEQAITNSGLVVDSTQHVGEMLSRTKDDVGGTKDLFAGADVYSFCSAVESRKAMAADITNIRYCPYNVFVYATPDAPGTVVIGHRVYPGDDMAGVNAMLDAIVDAAAD